MTDRPCFLKKLVCGVLTVTITALPFPHVVWAGDNSDTQRFNDAVGQGTSTARQMKNELEKELKKGSGSSMSYKGLNIDGSTFFPDSNKIDTSRLFPDSTYSKEQLEKLDSDEALKKHGLNAQSALYEDASSANPTAEGSAYKIIADSRKKLSRKDLSNDSVTDTAKKVFAMMDEDETFGKVFPDCDKLAQLTYKARTTHVPDYQVCNKLVDKSSDCTLLHSLGVPDIITTAENSRNSINIKPCDGDELCFETWVGENYWDNHDNCKEYYDYVTLNVLHPEAITQVILSNVAWDDYMALMIAFDGKNHLLYNTTGTLPIKLNTAVLGTTNEEAKERVKNGETVYIDRLHGDAIVGGPRCENKGEDCYYNRCNGGKDVIVESTVDGISLTQLFKSVTPDQQIELRSITSTADDGKYHAKLKVYYDPAKLVFNDDYSPTSCMNAALSIDEDKADGSYKCTKMAGGLQPDAGNSTTGEDLCVKLNGLRVCESQLERPLKGLSPLCTEATVSAKTVYWKAADDDSDVQLNQCEELEKNCDWVSENCVKDAEGELSGNCYVYEEVYDCGKDTDSQQALMQTKYSCDGDIRCVGDDCVSSEYDISTSFGKVSALLNAAEMMGQDLQCIGVDANGSPVGDVDVNCFVFSGTHRTCHNSMKGMGGLEVNCCESHAGISLSEYVSLVMMLPKIDTAIMSMESGSMIRGAYNTLRQPVADGLNAVGKYLSDLTKPFTSWVENVTGMDGLFSDSSTSIMDSITGKIKEKATEMIKKMLVSSSENGTVEAAAGGTTGEGTDQIADAASKQAAEMVEGISTALSVIGYIYAAYQITCMLSHMIFACEDDELTLAAQRKMKNCTYVGQYCSKKVLKTCIQKAYSYCCFTSPLGRIINEQVKEQMGQPFRTMDPKHPNCMGISIAEIETIDWDRIDLGEWTSILIETDNYKELQNMTLDSLTGSGSLLNIDYSTDPNTEITRSERANTLERTINRLDKINLESEKIKTDNSTEVDVTGKKSE